MLYLLIVSIVFASPIERELYSKINEKKTEQSLYPINESVYHEETIDNNYTKLIQIAASNHRYWPCKLKVSVEYVSQAIRSISKSRSYYKRSSKFQKSFLQVKAAVSAQVSYKLNSVAFSAAVDVAQEDVVSSTDEKSSSSYDKMVFQPGTWQIWRILTTEVYINYETLVDTKWTYVSAPRFNPSYRYLVNEAKQWMKNYKGKYTLVMEENFNIDTTKSIYCKWVPKYACGGDEIGFQIINMERCVVKCFQVNHCKCVSYVIRSGACHLKTGPYLWNTGNSVWTGLEVYGPCKTRRELAKCQWKKQHVCVGGIIGAGGIIGDYRLTRAEGIEKCLHIVNCHCVIFYPLENVSRLTTGPYTIYYGEPKYEAIELPCRG